MGVRSQLSLTKRTVDAAHPTDKRYYIWDSDLRGFGLRIEPSGIKTFVTKYRVNGGGRNAPQRIQTVGRYGTLTPEEARRKAKAILGSVAAGSDPAGDLAARRREMTIAALIDFYETHGCVVQRGKRIGDPHQTQHHRSRARPRQCARDACPDQQALGRHGACW